MATIATMAACGFQSPAYDGTAYACAATVPHCPPGFTCQGDRCLRDDGPPPSADAALTPTDAAPIPPDGALVTTTFGERSFADHQGVTIDTTISANDPDVNLAADEIVAIDATPVKATLMRFDLTAIPPGAAVQSATLDVFVPDPIETGSFRLHALTEAWTEDGATFVDRQAGVPWTAPGAVAPSSDPAVLADIEARTIGPTTLILDAAIVQGWVAAPGANLGFVWISTSPDGRGGELRSSEYVVANERPLLRVTYQP